MDSQLPACGGAQRFHIGRLPGGSTANNLRNGKRVALAALEGMPLLFFVGGFCFFFELELGGHQPQNTVNWTTAL
jgi:hypothetical protein